MDDGFAVVAEEVKKLLREQVKLHKR